MNGQWRSFHAHYTKVYDASVLDTGSVRSKRIFIWVQWLEKYALTNKDLVYFDTYFSKEVVLIFSPNTYYVLIFLYISSLWIFNSNLDEGKSKKMYIKSFTILVYEISLTSDGRGGVSIHQIPAGAR